MKRILVLGAGQSAPYLIQYLLDHAEQYDWFVTVGDRDLELAQKRVKSHPRGNAIFFDINDGELLVAQVKRADVVVYMLPPRFQAIVARECIDYNTHMITVSYRDRQLRDFHNDAMRRDVLILSELGLDPGIDHMSAMSVISRIHDNGGSVVGFCSYGSGIPAPDSLNNPLRYVITWNPRNVAMAGELGAQYLEEGKIKIVPWHHLFRHTWQVNVDGIGILEAYPNRDSMSYQRTFGLKNTRTMIRGTLRWPGWCETWLQIVRLGLPNENMRIPNLSELSYRDVVAMFLPHVAPTVDLEDRVANFLQISPTGRIMENLRWFGLFSDEKIGVDGESGADMLVHMLRTKLPLTPDARDMVVLVHELDVEYPEENNRTEKIISTFVHYGERGGFTAMAKAVGLPAAVVTKMVLQGQIQLTGCHIPTHPSIYEPVLNELGQMDMRFVENVIPVTS